MELQKLLDEGNNDPNVLDRCNRILPTYNGFLHSFNSKGLEEDNLQEWDEDLFKNALQGRKRKRRKGAMDSASKTKKRRSHLLGSQGSRDRRSYAGNNAQMDPA